MNDTDLGMLRAEK